MTGTLVWTMPPALRGCRQTDRRMAHTERGADTMKVGVGVIIGIGIGLILAIWIIVQLFQAVL